MTFRKMKKPSESLGFSLVGMTGFEPATPRPPGVYATRLRHIPIYGVQRYFFYSLFKQFQYLLLKQTNNQNAQVFNTFISFDHQLSAP